MPQYNFEGDINNISERQLQFICSVILEQGFKNCKIFFEPVGKVDENYAANVKRITINEGNKSLQMIAKIAPVAEHVRQTMNTILIFKNEHLMYTEVLPHLVQLQRDADIAEEEQLRYAKCYGSLLEQPHEVILLEDLKLSDFKMLDRFLPLPDDCVKSVLKNFAILHSLSFVLKHKEQDTYNTFKNSLSDIWGLNEDSDIIKLYYQALEADTLTILEDEKHINILRGKVANNMDLAVKCSEMDSNNKYTVIQQGDPWTNNIMFKFEGDKLTKSIMIDYQLSKSTSPVGDILYMIFSCTDHETRKKKFYDWIDFYYSELDKSLSNFGLKANLVYPRDILNDDLKQYSGFYFGLTIFAFSMIVRKSDDAAKMKDAMNSENILEETLQMLVSTLDKDSKRYFRDKVIGLIESFVEFGWF